MSVFQSHEALRSEYPQCRVCCVPCDSVIKVVPPNGSEAPLVVNKCSESPKAYILWF